MRTEMKHGDFTDPNRGKLADQAKLGGPANILSIDLKSYLDTTNSEKKHQVVMDMKFACEDTGFFIIEDHGIGKEIIGDTLKQLKFFMSLNTEEKLRQKSRDLSKGYRGYAQMGNNMTVERFYFGHPKNDNTNYFPNDEIREVFTKYYLSVEHLFFSLMQLLNDTMELSPGTLERALDFRDGIAIFNYSNKHQKDGSLPNLVGHVDWGPLAIVYNTGPGLEVFQDNEWRPVISPPGSFIINLGDMLTRLTNGRWKSTLHRVQNNNTERMSLVFQACETMLTKEERSRSKKTIIQPLPGFIPESETDLIFEPISLDELMDKNWQGLSQVTVDASYNGFDTAEN